MNFSENLKKIRKEHNLSQEQLAEQLGVSRQSVSKWESNQAYPEMDKMLQLCQLFNLNIDDLLNQDIKDVKNNKQVKNNINKLIDDFLNYITKTIDMLSNMSFKQKVKCLFEQIMLIAIITIIMLILGTILSSITGKLFSFIPNEIYYALYHIFQGLYIIFCLILGVTLILHIFKIRYLDYYIIDKEELTEIKTYDDIKEDDIKNEKVVNNEKIGKKNERIIIRDPKHTSYNFISSLLKSLIFIIKIITFLISVIFCFTFVLLTICFIISFIFIKTGILFFGILLGIIASLIINLIIINILYNFIINNKNQKTKLAIIFIISLILLGSGIGFTMIGITNFNVISNIEISDSYEQIIEQIEMKDDLVFIDYYQEINYIESNNQDIKIVIDKSEFYNVYINNYRNNEYHFNHYFSLNNVMKNIKKQINDINNKKIVDYSNLTITIYTTKENIQILKNNRANYEKLERGFYY